MRRLSVMAQSTRKLPAISKSRALQLSRRPIYTGWKVVGVSAALWALQSMLWMQGFGNLAVELRRQFGWSKTLFSVAFVGTAREVHCLVHHKVRLWPARGPNE